jgi:hypothetical protein
VNNKGIALEAFFDAVQNMAPNPFIYGALPPK